MSVKELYKKANKHNVNKKYSLAIEYYHKALQIDENHLKSLKELSTLYENINDNENAIIYYKKLLNLTPKKDIPNTVICLNQIGVCYNKLKNYNKSIEYFKKALHFKNDISEIYDNLSVCYFNTREYKLSEINSLISMRLNNCEKVNKDLGFLYFCLKEYDKSIKYYNDSIKFNNDNSLIYSSSFSYLGKKDFKNGFKLYDYRLKNNDINPQTGLKERIEIPQIPYWDGVTECSELLILYEQGIGDNIQYYRFIVELAKLNPNMKITYFCKDTVSNILREYDNIVIAKELPNIFKYNYKLYIMSLPYILKIDYIKPLNENYIKIDSDSISIWREKLKSDKLKVGFFYKGMLDSHIEKKIALSEFKNLTDLNIDLICLHKSEEIKNDLDNCSFGNKIINYDIDITSPFVDTISILKNIDLLITVDTSIVHLAGVLGIKTFLMLGHITDWRWFNNNDKVWYDSVELFRMEENKELKHILPKIVESVNELINNK